MKKVPDFSKAKGTPAKKAKKAAASKSDTKMQSAAKASRVVLAAAMLSMPAVMVPQQAAAQSTVGPPISPTKPVPPMGAERMTDHKHTEYLKIAGTFTVMGVGDGHTIFKAADGSMFYLDPMTGDKRSVAVDYFLKIGDIKGENRTIGVKNGGRAGGMLKIKFTDLLVSSIVGRDASGNPVLQNARNETFTLDPRTGDKVFIKWPK
ncbi:MAG: hypothetical protein WC700_11140 [Gemmatimonadaceae bacterium]|jgi:hypothetical protein